MGVSRLESVDGAPVSLKFLNPFGLRDSDRSILVLGGKNTLNNEDTGVHRVRVRPPMVGLFFKDRFAF